MNEPNRHEQLLRQAINKTRFFFEGYRSGDSAGKPHFFRLFSVKTIESSSKGATSFYVNFEHTELEDSLVCLENALKALGSGEMRYIVISLVTSKTSNNDYQIRFDNPYFTGSLVHMQPGQQQSSVAGFGQQNYYPQQQTVGPTLFELQKQHQEQMTAMLLEVRDLKHQRERDDLENTIASLQYGNIGQVEKLVGTVMKVVSSDAGKPLVQALVARIAGVPMAPQQVRGGGSPQSDNQPPPVQQAQPVANQNNQTQPSQQQASITKSIIEIKEVFPDIDQAMADLAFLIKHQPDAAKQLRGQAQLLKNGEQ